MDKTFTIDLTGTDEEIDRQMEAMFAELKEQGIFFEPEADDEDS